MVAAPHFNFRSHVLRLVASRSGSAVGHVREVSCAALGRLFEVDRQGDVTLEVVKIIAKAVKEGRFRAPADAVRTFLKLPLEVEEDSLAAKALLKAAGKKQQQQRRNEKREIEEAAEATEADIEASLREADTGFVLLSCF